MTRLFSLGGVQVIHQPRRRLWSNCLLVASSLAIYGSLPSTAGDSPAVSVVSPASSSAHGTHANVKVSYDVKSLHNDGQRAADTAEVMRALERIPNWSVCGINSGNRDQYVAGVNHLYANDVNQRLGNCFYTQGIESDDGQITGENGRINSFTGFEMCQDPMIAATIDGIAFMEESLTGKPNMAAGAAVAADTVQNPRVALVSTGADLDKAWDANGGTPMIIAVNANTNMFVDVAEAKKEMNVDQLPYAGHVVVIAARRERSDGSRGRTSAYEYKLLNSWGDDLNGRPRNGWVGSDPIVSAMNFWNGPGQVDESVEPHRALEKDALPHPSKNAFRRGSYGLKIKRDTTSVKFDHAIGATAGGADSGGATDTELTRGSLDDLTAELRKHVADPKEGFDADERALVEGAILQILANKDSTGTDRMYPISDKEKAGVFHGANRLFKDSGRIYAQGLDQGDRNRALVSLLHDTANPDHINQGAHETCNVTTMTKIESFLRPAAQVKRFVDMYTNARGDRTVNMPG